MFLAFNRSPTFLPLIRMRVFFAVPTTGVETQSSNSGRGSPMNAPEYKPPAILPAELPGVLPSDAKGVSVGPAVLPEIRLIAPGVDGPNPVLKELSLNAKCCA